jgi:hypothetical protein
VLRMVAAWQEHNKILFYSYRRHFLFLPNEPISKFKGAAIARRLGLRDDLAQLGRSQLAPLTRPPAHDAADAAQEALDTSERGARDQFESNGASQDLDSARQTIASGDSRRRNGSTRPAP